MTTQTSITLGQILTADTTTLFLRLQPYVRMWKADPQDGTAQQTWHMSLDGDAYADCDITLGECGHAQRSALFTRALMHAASAYGLILGLTRLGSSTPGQDDLFEATVRFREHAEISFNVQFEVRATSPELALMRAFLSHLAGNNLSPADDQEP